MRSIPRGIGTTAVLAAHPLAAPAAGCGAPAEEVSVASGTDSRRRWTRG